LQYRKLGLLGPEVSVLSFGAWQIGDPKYWGEDAETDAKETVRKALDAGITLFDTAEGYGEGESERVLGTALGADRDKVLVATKISSPHCTAAGVRAACEGSLKRLGTDRIDLYQIHWPFRTEPFLTGYGEMSDGVGSFEEVYDALAELKTEGKIVHIGVSNFGATDIERWAAQGEAVSNQLGYNMVFRAIEYSVAPACRREGMGILAYMPLMQGLLTGRYPNLDSIPPNRRRTRHFSSEREGTRHGESGCEPLLMHTIREVKSFSEAIGVPMSVVALAWVLAQPGVSSAIVGARKAAQLAQNLPAANIDLGPAAIAQLNEIPFPLKRHMGRNPDLWQSGKNARVI
jgi:aryl-alcohol dehydrogenase-like predicted oxidoreductase